MIVKRIERKVSTAKKRVAAYCRVSTQRNEQEESFETQKAYYEEHISRNPDWELVKIYSDKHSATSVKNRPGFQEMMADAKARRIDILLVKSISRFARNVVDCQKYLQKLESYGVCVQFEKENIRTDDPTSGFVLSLLSAVAQDESHSISKNVQLSYESRFKRGEYNFGNNQILGYDCVKGKLAPNADAWIIREIFRRFLEGQTYREIADGLAEMGAKTLRGNAFSVEAIRYIVRNETYVGDKLLQKQPPKDYLTKKPDPNRKYASNYLKDDHEGIIDRDTWERTQVILQQREECSKLGVYKRNKAHHVFYGKVFCGECGAHFRRRTYTSHQHPYKAWNCKERQKGAQGNGCRNRIIREDELMQTVLDRLGWKELDEERFRTEVSRVLVYQDRIEIE